MLSNGAEILERACLHGQWIVLCRWVKSRVEYVTWYCDKAGHVYWGHYFTDLERAAVDFKNRVSDYSI